MRCQSRACDWLVLREARIKLAHARGFLFCEALGGLPRWPPAGSGRCRFCEACQPEKFCLRLA